MIKSLYSLAPRDVKCIIDPQAGRRNVNQLGLLLRRDTRPWQDEFDRSRTSKAHARQPRLLV